MVKSIELEVAALEAIEQEGKDNSLAVSRLFKSLKEDERFGDALPSNFNKGFVLEDKICDSFLTFLQQAGFDVTPLYSKDKNKLLGTFIS